MIYVVETSHFKRKGRQESTKKCTLIFLKNHDYAQNRVRNHIQNCLYMLYLKQKVSKWCTFYDNKVFTIQEFNSLGQKYKKLRPDFAKVAIWQQIVLEIHTELAFFVLNFKLSKQFYQPKKGLN